MTPEGKVKAQVKRMLDMQDIWYCKPAGVGYGRAGIPDIIACAYGHFLAIECKAGRGKTTALQDRELQAIRTSRGIAFVIWEEDLEGFGKWLSHFCATKRASA